MLTGFWVTQENMIKTPEDLIDKPTRHSRFALGVFLALLFAALGISYWVYSRQLDEQERQVRESLVRIVNNRAATIASIIHERANDAQITASSYMLSEAVSFLEQSGGKSSSAKIQIRAQLDTLKKLHGYLECAILDAHGNTLVSTEDALQPIDGITAQVVARVVASDAFQISSIRPTTISGKPYRAVDIAAPLFASNGQKRKTIAVLLLKVDPQQQIYPILQVVAPFPNLPNNVLLLEIRGQQVVLLNDHPSRYRFLDALTVTPQQLINSAKAATASLVFQETENDKTVAAVRPINGVPWFVAAEASEHAIHANAWETAWAIAASSLATLCILGAGILFWWKYKESEYQLAALQTETEKRFLQKQYDYLSKYANDMIILTDADYRILEANDRALQVLGHTLSSLIGQSLVVLSTPSSQDDLKESLDRLRIDGTAIFETVQQRSNSTVFPVEISARTIDFGGKFFNQFICRDISERKEAEHRIQSLAFYDTVTALPNRTLLNDRLEQAIHMATRSKKKVAVLFLDLDNFKNINDSLGHQIGDMLLYSVGQRLLECVRGEDTVARIGGDEFLILLPELDRGEQARHVAGKIIAEISKPFLLKENQIYTTTSIGISLFPDDSKKVPDLIKYADSALYEAKSRGRDNYQFFTRELNEQITRSAEIERQLRHAMDSGELCLGYQPQIDARDGTVIGAEALLRWRRGIFDGFTPLDFIAIAEERGLITKLGEWIIREACAQCRRWQLDGLRAIPVSVNVSPIQLQQKDFVELVLTVLREAELDASYLELEITEPSIMRRAKIVANLAMRLRDSGVRISIDDFGTGYFSLSFLKHIHIDKIKIDKSFIFDMLNDAEDETITHTIVNLGQSLQLRVIAEGVESQAQMERLLSFGCHEAQGYFYSEAVSPDEFQAFLAKDWRFAGMQNGRSWNTSCRE